MIVYDNVTMRNMRFCALMSETELEALKAMANFAVVTLEEFETPTIEDLTMLDLFRRIHKKLENPTIKPREGEKK